MAIHIRMDIRALSFVVATAFVAAACAPRTAPVPQPPAATAHDGWQRPSAHAGQPPRRTGSHPRLFEPPPTPRHVQHLPLEEAVDEPAVEEIAAIVEPELEVEAPPAWGSESLEPRIAAASAPNVTAAFRLIERGRQLLDRGEHEPALDALERAVSIDSNNAFGYFYLARLYFERNSHHQALGFASRAAILMESDENEWSARALALRGAILEAVARYPEAREAYRNALQSDPRNTTARVGYQRLGGSDPSRGAP